MTRDQARTEEEVQRLELVVRVLAERVLERVDDRYVRLPAMTTLNLLRERRAP